MAKIKDNKSIGQEKFSYTFVIESKNLENYALRLFNLTFPISFYPLNVKVTEPIAEDLHLIGVEKVAGISCKNEEEYVQALKKIFTSRYTKQVINSIQSLVRTKISEIF